MSSWVIIGIAAGALVALTTMLALLAVAVKKLANKLESARTELATLEQKFAALQQQNQNDILAIGQRMLDADKLVRKFNERLDGIESGQFTEVQYGQLESLLDKGVTQQSEASNAEVELLSLLRRQQQRP
jgi:predicted  nucleic acid-binding Zn-ribbon protein